MSQAENTTLPYSQESEMIVLGCMLTNAGSLYIGIEVLEASDFYCSEHKIIFNALKEIFLKNKPADIHLVAEELKRTDKLTSVGGIAYLASLAQYAGTAAHIEEYIELVREKSMRRKMIFAAQEIQKQALNHPSDIDEVLSSALEAIEEIPQVKKLSIIPMKEKMNYLEKKLQCWRGQKYLGLCQKTLPTLDDGTLGLRKFLLLAAAPNVGKTAFTIQLALDVLKHNEQTCLVYFSLEMPTSDILIRMFCNLSQLDCKTFVTGSGKQNRTIDPDAYFNQTELSRVTKAKEILDKIGDKIQIIDSTQAPLLDAKKAISFIHELKQKTDSHHVIVIIDYLQVWPRDQKLKFSSEIEIDQWRVGEIKKIRDAMNDDPVIVISEARKPSGKDLWGSDMSDVMGSARVTYSPDGVLLLSRLDIDAICKLVGLDKNVKDSIEKLLKEKGMSICHLHFPKARDCMEKFSLYLKFHYRKNTFEEVSVEQLRKEFDTVKKVSSWTSKNDGIEDDTDDISYLLPKV